MEEMPDIIKGFTHTEYLTVFNAIIFGYVGAEYFQGWGNLIRNRKTLTLYWQHTLWTIFSFTLFIQNWWGIWPRIQFIDESLFFFFYSLTPICLFYFISVVLFPDFKNNSETRNMEQYFYKNTRMLFGLFALYFVFTITSSLVYPDIGNVTVQNLIRFIGIILAASAGYFSNNRVLHTIFLFIGYASLIWFFTVLPG